MSAQIKDGGPAFPVACSDTVNYDAGPQHGMTLRDWFAGQALGALVRIENDGIVRENDLHDCFSGGTAGCDRHAAFVAEEAYVIADAMLAEREKKGEQ